MDDRILKAVEFEINSLISLRNTYYSILLVLMTGIIGLFYNLNLINIILLLIGLLVTVVLFMNIFQISYRIKYLIKLTRGF